MWGLNDRMTNNESELAWKEAVVAQFTILSWNLLGEKEARTVVFALGLNTWNCLPKHEC